MYVHMGIVGYPLHRLREFGSSVRDLDVLDEDKLTGDQIKSVCSYM